MAGKTADQYMEGVQKRPKSAGTRRPQPGGAAAPAVDAKRVPVASSSSSQAVGGRPTSASAARRRQRAAGDAAQKAQPAVVGNAVVATATVSVPEEYMAKKVDPLMKDLIAQLLSQRPDSVIAGALAFMRARAAGAAPPPIERRRVSRHDRLYMAREVSPLLIQLIGSIVKAQPGDVETYAVARLEKMARATPALADADGGANDENYDPSAPSRARSKLAQAQQLDSVAAAPEPVPAAAVVAAPEPAVVAAPAPVPAAVAKPAGPPRELIVLLLGDTGAGKTTLLQALGGNADPTPRPTMGFKKVSLPFESGGEEVKLSFIDLGGKKSMKATRKNYYADVHSIVYVVDAAQWAAGGADEAAAQKALFDECFGPDGAQSEELRGKPLLIVANKQDGAAAAAATPADDIAAALGAAAAAGGDALAIGATCHPLRHAGRAPAAEGEEEPEAPLDERLLEGVDWIAARVVARHAELAERVVADMEAQEAKRREAQAKKEANVFRTVLKKAFVVGEYADEKGPVECFDEHEGLGFFASELGVTPPLENGGDGTDEAAAHAAVERAAEAGILMLGPEPRELAQLVGYQKLAMQMMGGWFNPINKKKRAPMSWAAIRDYVLERRAEVGLPPPGAAAAHPTE